MSSQGEYTITQDPEQNIPVELVRAAAKIKLNISSTVKDYHIKAHGASLKATARTRSGWAGS